AVSGDTVVVGALFAPVGSHSEQGAAFVFTRPVGGWADATQTAKLAPSDGIAGDCLGWSVAVSGNTVVAGAPDPVPSTDNGAVYVFTRPVGGWADATQTAKFTASDGAVGAQFGMSVAVSGDTVVAGTGNARLGSNAAQGAAYVFTKPGGGWADAQEAAE